MGPGTLTAFVDANVLYSRTLRDWLAQMAIDSQHTAYRLCWSEAVLTEVFYRRRRDQPSASEAEIENWRDLLDAGFPGCKVKGWDPAQVPPPADINDHHVVAAAYTAKVHKLLTNERNSQDMQRCLDAVNSGIEVMSADDFLCEIAARHPRLVRQRFNNQIAYVRKRAKSGLSPEDAAEQAVEALDKAQAPRFSFMLRTDERFRLWTVGSTGLMVQHEDAADREKRTGPGRIEPR